MGAMLDCARQSSFSDLPNDGTSIPGFFLAAIRRALELGDRAALAQLMNRNFDTRRHLFGDEVLGKVNLHMIACARSVGGTTCSHAQQRLRRLKSFLSSSCMHLGRPISLAFFKGAAEAC